MIRGTRKQIIHLTHTGNPLFEEAFLIVRHPTGASRPRREMVEEAARLLSPDADEKAGDNTPDLCPPVPQTGTVLARLFSHAAAFALGMGLATLLAWVTVLLLRG